MPKLRKSEAQKEAERKAQALEYANRLLLAEIRKGQCLCGERPGQGADAVGMNVNTMRYRRRDPGSYRLFELRRLAEHYGWNDRTIAEIFGVPYHGSSPGS